MKHEKAELAKVYKKLMRFGLDLLGFPFKKSVPAVPRLKPACKISEKSVNSQNKKKNTVK